MKIGRVDVGGDLHWCEPDGDGVRLLDGSITQGFTRGSRRLHAGEYRHLSPAQPGTLLVVLGAFRPDLPPELAAKLASTVIAPGADIVVPPEIGDAVTVEPELAVVIGTPIRRASRDDAADAVLGYTCFNDVTHLPFLREQNDILRAKSIDTFGPCGPWIDTDLSEADVDAGLAISAYVNDVLVHSGNTKEFTNRVADVVSEASRFSTLSPGDLISLGTPPGPALARVGDTVRVEIEQVGSLINPVVAETRATARGT
jgi:2-keto-4-pentenoate hydratase/2-oxohepta-3-ene-1,7-dioic acid hydratase in catechol pathway